VRAVWKSDLHNRESLRSFIFDFLQELLIISEATLSTIPGGVGGGGPLWDARQKIKI